VLAREPAPLGEALGEVLRRDGIELVLGVHATAARRDGDDYVARLDDGRELRGDRLLVATGRRPRVRASAWRRSASSPIPTAVPTDSHLRAGERLWAVGDITGIWPLTHTGKYQGEVVAANILGESREANYEAVPRVTYTDPQAAAVGAAEASFSATAYLNAIAKTETYTRAYAESNGYLTLLSDGERPPRRPRARPRGRRMDAAGHAGHPARIPLDVLRDTIQPFPTFSEIYVAALQGAPPRDRGVAARWRPRDVRWTARRSSSSAAARASGSRRPGSPATRGPTSSSPPATRSACSRPPTSSAR
jgi:dihydrolipoamide dehydrogenase